MGSPVKSWDGRTIHDPDEISYVIDWKRPSKVQQCADVAIRLYAEYLRDSGQIDTISFRSLSNDEISYTRWLTGKYKLNSNGSGIIYQSSSSRVDSNEEFENYLQFVMEYANSSSLARDLPEVGESDILPGDLYIQPDPSGRGGIGHVSIVLDICENSDDRKYYLFGYGFIPAQDFHIPKPSGSQGEGAWFTLDGFKEHVSPFGEGNFHRFQ